MTPIDPFRDRLREHARATRCRVIFTDGDNSQVIQAALKFQTERSVYPILISRGAVLEVESIHPGSSPDLNRYTEYLEQRFVAQNLPAEDASLLVRKPLYFGLIAIACGDADCCITSEDIAPGEISAIASSFIPVSQIDTDMGSEEIYAKAATLAEQVTSEKGR